MRFRAMATDVTLRLDRPKAQAPAALQRAKAVFARVESACTRFDTSSPLMVANAEPTRWHDVPLECAEAVAEAARAYRETNGAFDPRVLTDLVELGYDRTLPFAQGSIELDAAAPAAQAVVGPARPAVRATVASWTPRREERSGRHLIHLGGTPIDLGGIGKGLAVRWAAEQLREAAASVLVEAGGDCQFTGTGPDGQRLAGRARGPAGRHRTAGRPRAR